MAIYFFIKRCPDGAGDIVQTVKTAAHVQKMAEAQGQKVIIVVPEADNFDHEAITKGFVDNMNVNIEVQTLSTFKKSSPQIDCCIEAGYSTFFWREEIKDMITEETPMIFMTEFNSGTIWNNRGGDSKNTRSLYTGFNLSGVQIGVIPSQDLLDVTSSGSVPDEALEKAFSALDPKVKKHLGGDAQSYLSSRQTHSFSYQYSHDRNKYTLTKSVGGAQVDTDDKVTPAKLYLEEHIMLNKESDKSQVVLCVGGNDQADKKEALIELKDSLISSGYTSIVFQNVDDDSEEQEIYRTSDNDKPQKEYRVLYSKAVPFSTMQSLPLLSDDLVGATGDNSAVEAMSAGKLVSYECIQHKTNFVNAYIKNVRERTQSDEVIRLATLLMKVPNSSKEIRYDKDEMQSLLQKKDVVNELKTINRTMVNDSQYFKRLDTSMAELNVFGRKATATLTSGITDSAAPSPTSVNTSEKIRELFKDSEIPTSYIGGKYPRSTAAAVLQQIQPEVIPPTPTSLKNSYIEGIHDRYKSYNMSDQEDYNSKIKQLISLLEGLNEPDMATIKATMSDWFAELPLAQQNQFRGEMPLMVNDCKGGYLDKISLDGITNIAGELRELKESIQKLHNPEEFDILDVIETWQQKQNPVIKAEIDAYLTSKGIQKESPGMGANNIMSRFKTHVRSYRGSIEPQQEVVETPSDSVTNPTLR